MIAGRAVNRAAGLLLLLAACEVDEAPVDAGREVSVDVGASDAGTDSGVDAGTDAGFDAGCVPTSTTVVTLTSTTPPRFLSETGLFTEDVRAFAPAYRLWSDGAEKKRWVSLPECTQIDTSDMDHWELPVGAKLFKEFSIGGVRLETRLIARLGPEPDDYLFAAYVWNDAETDAEFTSLGARGVKGTNHDVPGVSLCESCHGHLPERVLGFGAVQLSHEDVGVTLSDLVREGRLTAPPADRYTAPNDALGYLHANCGNCHFADVRGGIEFITPFDLRLTWDVRTASVAPAVLTAVGVGLEKFVTPGVLLRIQPGDPDLSGVVNRMSQRQNLDQMPPIATKIVDADGLMLIRTWVSSL